MNAFINYTYKNFQIFAVQVCFAQTQFNREFLKAFLYRKGLNRKSKNFHQLCYILDASILCALVRKDRELHGSNKEQKHNESLPGHKNCDTFQLASLDRRTDVTVELSPAHQLRFTFLSPFTLLMFAVDKSWERIT